MSGEWAADFKVFKYWLSLHWTKADIFWPIDWYWYAYNKALYLAK